MSDNTSHFVILTNRESLDPMTIAKALAATRKTPLQDQMMVAKNGWGILAENLSQAEAQNLVDGLRGFGVEGTVLPASSLLQLPSAAVAIKMESAPTQDLVLIAAAGITMTSTTTKTIKEGPSAAQKVLSTAILLGTGLPIKIGGKERTVEKKQEHSELVFYVDLLYKDPWRRCRINAEKFDYSFLKERKLYQVLGNFKLLLGDWVKAAPEAWTNRGTQILLANKQINTMGYRSLADLEKESRWLLTLQTLNH